MVFVATGAEHLFINDFFALATKQGIGHFRLTATRVAVA
jgi:hypothetical protein